MVQIAGSTPGTIQIKTRLTGAAGAPTSLASGEMAWNSVDKILYFGDGDNGSGIATSIVKLAGAGAFLLASLLGAANGIAPLDSTGKVPLTYIPSSLVGGLNYQTTWNAATNTPQLLSGQGTKGYYYKVSTAGIAVPATVGTAQSGTGTVVNLSSVSGLAVGMVASNNANVPAGTTIAGISGNNVTLSAPTSAALAAGANIRFATYLDGSGGGTAGAPNFNPGDLVVYNGATWDKVDGPAEAVLSVAGRVGAVVLTSADITDASPVGKSLLTAVSVAAQRVALGIDAVTVAPDAAYQVLATDYNVQFGTLTASRVATLAAASSMSPGQRVRLGDRSGSASSSVTISVTPSGSDKINGSASPFVISAPYGQVEMQSDGTGNFTIMGQTAPASTGMYGGSF